MLKTGETVIDKKTNESKAVDPNGYYLKMCERR